MGALRQQKITPSPIPSSRPSPLAINMPKLEIIVSGGNFKRMDTKAYNITKKEAWVKLQVAGQEVTTTRVNCPMLDPVFDETFVLDINDPATDKVTVTFYLADTLIGQPADYILRPHQEQGHLQGHGHRRRQARHDLPRPRLRQG